MGGAEECEGMNIEIDLSGGARRLKAINGGWRVDHGDVTVLLMKLEAQTGVRRDSIAASLECGTLRINGRPVTVRWGHRCLRSRRMN